MTPDDIAYYKLTTKGYKQLSQDPTYKDLIGRKRIQYIDNPIAERLPDEVLCDTDFQECLSTDLAIFGSDTPASIVPHLLRLWNFLLTEPVSKLPIHMHDVLIVEEKGISFRS